MIPMGGGGVHMFMWGQRGDMAKKRPTVAMYRRLLRFVGPYRWNLALAAALLVISTALGLVWPQIVQRVLDLGFKEPGLLDELVVVLIAVLLVRAVIDGVRQFVMAWTGESVIFDLRMAIVNHLQSMSLSFFNVRKTGDLMSHVTSDATLVHGVVTQTIIQVLGQVLTLVGGVTIIFLMNWRLALLTLVVAPPIGIIGQYLGRKIRDISRAAQDAPSAGSRRGRPLLRVARHRARRPRPPRCRPDRPGARRDRVRRGLVPIWRCGGRGPGGRGPGGRGPRPRSGTRGGGR